jgi:hypothetical protein
MTPPRDTDAERLAEALVGVTPGPWTHYAETCAECTATNTCEWLIDGPLGAYHGQFSIEADARFIALCREAVPALLESHAALRKALEAVINIPAVKQVLGTKHTAGCDCPMCKARALLTDGASHG